MKLRFDEETWTQLEEYLKVAHLCGENAGQLHGFARGVAQRTVASMGDDRDVAPSEAAHALAIMSALRNSSHDAARGFAAATARIDELIRQLEPALGKPRTRQKNPNPTAPPTPDE